MSKGPYQRTIGMVEHISFRNIAMMWLERHTLANAIPSVITAISDRDRSALIVRRCVTIGSMDGSGMMDCHVTGLHIEADHVFAAIALVEIGNGVSFGIRDKQFRHKEVRAVLLLPQMAARYKF